MRKNLVYFEKYSKSALVFLMLAVLFIFSANDVKAAGIPCCNNSLGECYTVTAPICPSGTAYLDGTPKCSGTFSRCCAPLSKAGEPCGRQTVNNTYEVGKCGYTDGNL